MFPRPPGIHPVWLNGHWSRRGLSVSCAVGWDGQAARRKARESPAPLTQQLPPKPRSLEQKDNERWRDATFTECEKEGLC